PLPVEKPDELVAPFWGGKKDAEVWGGVSYANYVDLRERNQSLSGLLAWSLTWAGVSSGASERADVGFGESVSGNYFDVLGVKLALGRGFCQKKIARRIRIPWSSLVIRCGVSDSTATRALSARRFT